MKCRLCEAALADMDFPFAGQQAFAYQPLGPLQRKPLHEALIASDENFLDVVGMIQKKRGLRA
jgi:hypothetical protein